VAAKPKTSVPSHFHGRSAPLELSPGVRAGTSTIRTAEDAAARAVELAVEAGKQGTFAVGGLLVDESGHVIAEATNAVIRNGKLSDPTAHVERQLVDWLAQQRRRRRSLSPRNLTIVSSLDPCASAWVSPSATNRKATSGVLPADESVMICTGLFGYGPVCASALATAATASNHASIKVQLAFIRLSTDLYAVARNRNALGGPRVSVRSHVRPISGQ
jgi:hypothetical protein